MCICKHEGSFNSFNLQSIWSFLRKKNPKTKFRDLKKSVLFCLGNLVCRHDDDDVNDDDDKEEYDQVMDDEDV